jgi:hypothetical protein
MANVNASKPEPVKETRTKGEVAGAAPTDPTRLQPNQKTTGMLSTNPPRAVDELPAGHIADEPAAATLQKQVQDTLDSEEARGFRGAKKFNAVPNEAYTLKGVGRGDPTPETVVYTPESA